MVILDCREMEGGVGGGNGFYCVFFPAHHCPDSINILDNDIRLLVDSLEEAELILVCVD